MLVFWSFAITLLFCELGEIINNRFEDIAYELYQCNWYFFPIVLQRMLLNFMVGTQRPVLFRGFGNIACTRDAFKKVGFCFGFFRVVE